MEKYVLPKILTWKRKKTPSGVPQSEGCVFSDSDPRADTPPTFKGVLLPPQATLLHAMLILEQTQFIKIVGDSRLALAETRLGVISGKFSSGKSVLMAALMCASKCPKMQPFPVSGAYFLKKSFKDAENEIKGEASKNPVTQVGEALMCETSYSMRSYLYFRKRIPATLVISSASVIGGWEKNLVRFTDLRFIVVDSVYKLKELYAKIVDGEAGSAGMQPSVAPKVAPKVASGGMYDVVLLRIGTITNNFQLPGWKKPMRKKRNGGYSLPPLRILTALNMATEGRIWNRVIIDDYDSIKLTERDMMPFGFFTWLVSTTRHRSLLCSNSTMEHMYAPLVENFRETSMRFPIVSLLHNYPLYTYCHLLCEPLYSERFMETTFLNQRRIVVEGGFPANMLENLGAGDDIVEMVNSGAFNTAAEVLGNNSVKTSVEIVHAVLKDRLSKAKKVAMIVRRLEVARDLIAQKSESDEIVEPSLAKVENAVNSFVTYSTVSEKKLAEIISRDGYVPSGTFSVVNSAILEQKKMKETLEIPLKRLQENLAEEECQICREKIIGKRAIVVNCCQILICMECMMDSAQQARGNFLSICPNCTAPMKKGSILLINGCSKDVVDIKIDEDFPYPESVSADPGPSDQTRFVGVEDGDKKLVVLLSLMLGQPFESISDTMENMIIESENVIVGTKDIKRPEHTTEKWLIFAMHSESSRKIFQALEKNKINALLLKGTRLMKNRIFNRFENDPSVMALVVTASTDCSGVHLPFVTHVVFVSKILSKSIYEQAISRAQRTGRKFNLEVVVIWNSYENRDPHRGEGPR